MSAPTTEEVREALARAERDDARASRAYSAGGDTAPGYEMALEVAEHRDALAAEVARRGELLAAERKRYVMLQGTLDAERRASTERSVARIEEVARLREALEKRYAAGHNDTCAAMLGDYACSCGHDGLLDALAAKGAGR